MSLHEHDLKSRLVRFLGRKAAPRHLVGKDGAQADEIGALVAAVARCAPRGDDALAEWWPKFEASLGESCGNYWPSERDIRDAGSRHRASVPVAASDATDMSPAAITARQIARGEPVGVNWLYGISACELIGRRLVSEQDITRYRSAWFFSLRDAYGDDRARQADAEAKARHEAAKVVWRQREAEKDRRRLSIPDKSAPIPDGFHA